ncbi:hypothetical protein IVB18_47295 [Bradyrhizobium sp. 186]|uniref:hypothetical protein n=1 Tax=Bradyrhizobium sp. 186 TaxID=2782654 RepID=UPI002001CD89|nr:hypothetical protein [Bradyrhizobium sp. 186]UPK35472.1 hypothetical protein IVB18_47295 [Bradyrhizobium sp. 186]
MPARMSQSGGLRRMRTFPRPGPDLVSDVAERKRIRISSVEHPPERVVIDTNLPTIVPLQSEDFAPPAITVAPAQHRLQDAFAGVEVGPQSTTPKPVVDVAKAKHVAKREAAKKVVAHRAAPPLNIAPAPTYIAQQPTPSTRMSLLETLKERLGQTLFKLN